MLMHEEFDDEEEVQAALEKMVVLNVRHLWKRVLRGAERYQAADEETRSAYVQSARTALKDRAIIDRMNEFDGWQRNLNSTEPVTRAREVIEMARVDTGASGQSPALLTLVAIGSDLDEVPEADARTQDEELVRKVEHLEDKIFHLRTDTRALLKMFRGKQEEVDRLTEQLEACETLLMAQKRTDRLDKDTIASIANTVGLLVNTAMMMFNLSPEPAQQVQQAAIEVHSTCTVNEDGSVENSLTWDSTATTLDRADTSPIKVPHHGSTEGLSDDPSLERHETTETEYTDPGGVYSNESVYTDKPMYSGDGSQAPDSD